MSDQQPVQPEQPETRPLSPDAQAASPLSELESQRTHEEALHHRQQDVSALVMSAAHGRVEEETRQLTERMTREEQERRRALVATAPLIAPPTRRLPAPLQIHGTLVALDGSAYAERALPAAVALARLTGSALTLGVCTPPAHGAASATLIEEITSSHAAAGVDDRAPRAGLLDARDRVRAYVPNVGAKLITAPDAAKGLLTLERAIGAEVVALASHAREGVERIVLGSVADEVVRRGMGATLVTPPCAPDAQSGDVVFARALAPLDGSPVSEQSLAILQSLLQRGPQHDPADQAPGWLRTLTLLYVAENRAQLRDGEVYLREVREALLREATTPTEIDVQVELGSAPGAIVARASGATNSHGAPSRSAQEARASCHDLIVMATHGRGGAARWFYGSVASYVLAHSEVPVLLVHAPAED